MFSDTVDYIALSRTLTFDSSNSEQTVQLVVRDDIRDEPSESFFALLELEGTRRVEIRPEQAVINIEDNDGMVT